MTSLNLENRFNQKLKEILGQQYPKDIIIAVSGGIDSMALLFLSFKFCQNTNINLIALTIDHKIREESYQESRFVAQICQKNNIDHYTLENNSFIPKSNIESNLREIRYDLIANFAKKKNVTNILLAHHQQDVAENFLIRLFRGSGIDGLSAMDQISSFKGLNLIRSLLDFTKEELKNYLIKINIKYIEDPTNEDQKFLRNKIRKFLNDFEDKKIINQRIVRASKNILENRKIISDLVIKKAPEIYEFNNLGYFLLKKDKFINLNKELSFRYLNLIFNYFNAFYYKARLEKIDNVYNWILFDKDHKAKTFCGAIIEYFDQNNFIIYREKSKIKPQEIIKNQFIWDNRFEISIDQNLKLLDIEITHLQAEELNILLQNNNFKNYKNIKNPLKKVFYTIPVLKNNNKIIAIYNLSEHNMVEIKAIDANTTSNIKIDKNN